MKSNRIYTLLFFTGILPGVFMQCGNRQGANPEGTAFTPQDSLTEVYLVLQDSLHDTWNVMVSDDNAKIKAMKNLVHEMKIGTPYTPDKLASLDERINQLPNMRYTPNTLHNADLVEEYDFASNALVTELISMAESLASFSYNTTIQKLVEEIRAADMRVENYRVQYDSIAVTYNRFISRHTTFIKEITDDDSISKKPLFGTDIPE